MLATHHEKPGSAGAAPLKPPRSQLSAEDVLKQAANVAQGLQAIISHAEAGRIDLENGAVFGRCLDSVTADQLRPLFQDAAVPGTPRADCAPARALYKYLGSRITEFWPDIKRLLADNAAVNSYRVSYGIMILNAGFSKLPEPQKVEVFYLVCRCLEKVAALSEMAGLSLYVEKINIECFMALVLKAATPETCGVCREGIARIREKVVGIHRLAEVLRRELAAGEQALAVAAA
jgi:hypothetical protein